MTEGREAIEAWEKEKAQNYFFIHPLFVEVVRFHLGESGEIKRVLETTGALASSKADELSRETNRDENLPRLIDDQNILFPDSYHELGRLVWGTGVTSVLQDPGNEKLSGAIAYLLAHNGEAGHLCPVACTAGAIKLLQQRGSEEQKRRYLPFLLQSDYSKRLHASQFLTEIQGGSDVGANRTRAVAVPGKTGIFTIHGEKWFCSVADAGIFIVSARPEGAPPGTKGLGLFLVPRIIDGQPNRFRMNKLKYKLGTRSLATAEIDFEGAVAEQVGPLEDGFKNIVGIVLDTSRVYNALAACGIMSRALWEGLTFARHRTAFGQTIIQFPLIRRTLARMKLDWAAAIATTFRILSLSRNNVDAAAARRIDVSINKYWTSLRCTEVVRHAIEILGGNGTIEDFSVLPRLYRDSIVLESWEGTHNTLCMQIYRDFVKRRMHQPWLQEIRKTWEVAKKPELNYHRDQVAVFQDQTARAIQRLIRASELEAARWIRPLVDQMAILSGYAALLQLAEFSAQKEMMDLLEYYRRTYIESSSNLFDSDLTELENVLV